MAWRIANLVWGTLGTVGVFLWATEGRLDAVDAVDVVAGLVVLALLWTVVKLPWDLYFAARAVQVAQDESVERGIPIAEAERSETRYLVRRLLMFCLFLHLTGAGISFVAASFSAGRVGWFAAGAFLVSMALRPMVAMVGHVRRRLHALQSRARVPQDDARELALRLTRLEKEHGALVRQLEDDETGLVAVHGRVEGLAISTDTRLRGQEQRVRQDMDRVCVEFERSIEKLTADQELLAGIRAFLAMVRDRPGRRTVDT